VRHVENFKFVVGFGFAVTALRYQWPTVQCARRVPDLVDLRPNLTQHKQNGAGRSCLHEIDAFESHCSA